MEIDTRIAYKQIDTPLGMMYAGAVEKGICFLEFKENQVLDLKTDMSPDITGHFESLGQQLQEYFEGKRKQFTIPLVTMGTAFQCDVWESLQQITYGTTISYRQQSIALNKPEAIRAIASANGKNKISIVIPCHRVIGKDGNLRGYNGGVWRKKWLLDFEQAN